MLLRSKIEHFVRLACEEAKKGIDESLSPFGAVLTDNKGKLVGKAYNRTKPLHDVTAHAEVLLIRQVCKKLKTRNLKGYKIFINAEPCSMCMSAMIKAGIQHVYYGAPLELHTNPKVRAGELVKFSKIKVYIHPGILESECKKQIQEARLKSMGRLSSFYKK